MLVQDLTQERQLFIITIIQEVHRLTGRKHRILCLKNRLQVYRDRLEADFLFPHREKSANLKMSKHSTGSLDRRYLRHRESSSSLDIERIVAKLEGGMPMTRFFSASKKKPENRIYFVNVERMLFYWRRHDHKVEGSGIHIMLLTRRQNEKCLILSCWSINL